MDYLILFVALPILAGLFLYLTGKFVSVNLSALIPALLFIFSLWIFLTIDNREIMTNLMSLPLPYGMSLRVDSLSSLMLVLNNFLFLCMVIFSFKKKYMNKLFIFIFLSLEGIINGIFLSTDLFNTGTRRGYHETEVQIKEYLLGSDIDGEIELIEIENDRYVLMLNGKRYGLFDVNLNVIVDK